MQEQLDDVVNSSPIDLELATQQHCTAVPTQCPGPPYAYISCDNEAHPDELCAMKGLGVSFLCVVDMRALPWVLRFTSHIPQLGPIPSMTSSNLTNHPSPFRPLIASPVHSRSAISETWSDGNSALGRPVSLFSSSNEGSAAVLLSSIVEGE